MVGLNFLSKLGRSSPVHTIDEEIEKVPKSKQLIEAEQRIKERD